MLLTKQLLSFRPSKLDLIFACKTFVAGMIALYIAFKLDLAYPMWAIGTVFIIANPYAGLVSSKAIFRLIGTLIGAGMALFMMPHLINYPIIFTIVLASWTAFCLYISLLDRTPRSYMFMLAGYTCVMVATNAINMIGTTTSIFDIALGRVIEISIAVIVTGIVFSTIFPLHIGTAIQQRVEKALDDTHQIFLTLFEPQNSSQTSTELISALNRDTNDIHGLAVHLAYEKAHLKGMTRPLQEMLHQFSLVLVNLVAMAQRLHQLEALDPNARQTLQHIAENSIQFLQQKPDLSLKSVLILPSAFDADFAKIIENAPSKHAKIVLESLKMDMRHVIRNIYTVKFIWALIQQGKRKIPDFIAPLTTKYPSLHRDQGVAVRGALAAFVSTLIAFSIWIYSGWQYGYMMAQMAAILACILTALDDPIPTLKVFLRGSVYATIIVFIYLFFVLPDVKSFWQLAVVLAPVMIYAICLIPHPPLTGLGLPIAINVIMALNLQNHYQISPIASIDGAIAGLVGPIISILALFYIRAMSPDMTAKRLLEAHYRAMRTAIYLPFDTRFKIHIRSMLDRIGLLSTKMVQSNAYKAAINEALIETSASIDLTRLFELANDPLMPSDICQKINRLLHLLDIAFRQQQRHAPARFEDAETVFSSLNDLRDAAQQMDDCALQQRLWISLNNIRYGICHASMQAHLQMQNAMVRETSA